MSFTTWRAAAIYTVLTLLLAYPISLRPDRIAWANDPDGHLVMWLLAWDSHAFLTQPLSIFDANTFYPERRTLAYQENLIGSAFFAAPVLWLTGNPVLAANVVSLLACVLCGLGAYVLARRVGIGGAGALLCGVIFAFSPPRFLRFPQTHLAAVQWIPFALASLHVYFEGGRRRDLRLATAFFTLQVMASGHAGVFLVVAIVLMLAYRFALGEPILLAKRLRDFGIVGVLLFVPAVLFMIPYRINQIEMELRRSLGGWNTPIESFFASPTRVDVFLMSLITDRNINAAATAWLFPGFLPLGLALVAIVAGCAVLAGRARMAPHKLRAGLKSCATTPSVVAQVFRPASLPLACLLLAVLAWGAVGVARPFLRAGDGLAEQSYGGDKVAGSGFISVGRSGLYSFGMDSGDTSRLSVDNLLIIDHGAHNPGAPTTGSVQLTPGAHRVLLEYVQPGRRALNWYWTEGAGTNYRPVPSWALSRRPVDYTAVIAVRVLDVVRRLAAIAVVLASVWLVFSWLIRHHESWIESLAPARRNPTAFYFLLAAACIALALGPPYGLWQYVYWLPGFNFIRGSSRFMVLGLLGIAVLAGIGFERLSARLGPRSRWAAAGIIIALMSAEFAAQPFSTPYQFEVPAADQWVARQPKPFVVAEVPSAGGYERFQTMYMLHSLAHWQKTVHGYGGIRPYRHSVLYKELDMFPDTLSLQHLLDLDVTYLIVHIDMYPPEDWAKVAERLPAFSDRLELRYSDPAGRVYALRKPQETTRAN